MKNLFAPSVPLANLNVPPSGHAISFDASREDGQSPHALGLFPAGMPAAKNLTASSLDRPVFAYRWTGDGNIVLLAADGFTRKLIRFTEAGAREDIATPGSMPSSFAVTPSAAIAFLCASSVEPQDL